MSDPRDEVVTTLFPWVRFLVKESLHFEYETSFWDDLVSAGLEGLARAMASFDPTRGAQLKTYAEHRVRGMILDELERTLLVKIGMNELIPKAELVFATRELEHYVDPEHLLMRKLKETWIERTISSLPPRYAEIVRLRVHHDVSFREIADDLGLAEITVRGRFDEALAGLQAIARGRKPRFKDDATAAVPDRDRVLAAKKERESRPPCSVPVWIDGKWRPGARACGCLNSRKRKCFLLKNPGSKERSSCACACHRS